MTQAKPTTQRTLRIATRNSALALWQAEHIKAALERFHPGLTVELLGIKTQGDKILDVPLAKIGGKGLFVKELEEAMLDGRADLAVHSMKDVPMEFPENLGLVAICEREDPSDAFVSNDFENVDDLPEGAVVGTSSLRRQMPAAGLPAGPGHAHPARQRQYPPGQARCRRVRRHHPGQLRPDASGASISRIRDRIMPTSACPPSARVPWASSAGSTTSDCCACSNPSIMPSTPLTGTRPKGP